MGIFEILNSACNNCVYAIKGENEGCVSLTSLEAWPLAWTGCFLQRTENPRVISCVPGGWRGPAIGQGDEAHPSTGGSDVRRNDEPDSNSIERDRKIWEKKIRNR